MSTKGAKGKGKSRGAGGSQSRRSRSRNTTPASGSAISADTFSTDYMNGTKHSSYEELIEYLAITDNNTIATPIPSSASLSGLKRDLDVLNEASRLLGRDADRALRELRSRMEMRRQEDERVERERARRALEDAERKEKLKFKKRKAEPDYKRPPTTGASATADQGPGATVKADKRKPKTGSPEIKRQNKSPMEETNSDSDVEHQPPQAPPYVVFEPLEDDPTVYEMPGVTTDTPYEEKANAFAVARFPEDNLSKLIPGDPPDEDFSKAKPTNQVAINTFNTYIEPYFRPFSEEDLAFLRERGDKLTPYLIPKLGKHYSEQWAEEDGAPVPFASPAPPTNSSTVKNPNAPRGKPEDLNDDQLDREDVSCGPLLSRLLAAYMPEDPTEDGAPSSPHQPNGTGTTDTSHAVPANSFSTSLPGAAEMNWKIPTLKADYAVLDERIRREMVYVGLLDPNQETDYDDSQDDEISARLRMLQKKLREQSIVNGARKARIAEQLKEQLAYQEYTTILEDLDKQVEQAFAKRSRNMKASKKKKSAPNGVGVAQARVGIGEQARMLMERRKRWTDTIGPVFDKDITALPKGSIFEGMEELMAREKIGQQGDEE